MNDIEPDWRVRITPTGVKGYQYFLQTKDPVYDNWEGAEYWEAVFGFSSYAGEGLKGHARSLKKARKEAERIIDRVRAAWKHQHGVRAYVDSDKNIHFQ